MPKLQRLVITFLDDDAALHMPSSLLTHIPKLTYLVLNAGPHTLYLQDGLLQLSSLTDQQSLFVSGSLTLSTTPGFNALTALTSLCVQECSLDPSFLQHSTQLQSLRLKWIDLVSDPEDPAAASTMLLSCIAHMTNLEQLNIAETE